MIIFGAGLAGLLSANMMRSHKPTVYEFQSELPNNHGALLRFRSDKVGTATNTFFKKVKVSKAIKYDGKITTDPNLFLSNLYSQKVTGAISDRSINNLDSAERYIAPWTLISDMAEGCNISYDTKVDRALIEELRDWESTRPIISTLPMPMLMRIMDWGDIPDFPRQKIWTQRAIIDQPDCDIYQTIYYPDPVANHYRTSVIGNVIISEFSTRPDQKAGAHLMERLMDDFGITPKRLVSMTESHQEFGKIRPIDESIRKEFIFQMTSKHNIYSVGRFATWRQLLLDDVVDDLKIVESFVRGKDDYSRLVHSQKGIEDES
jgi:hypothetical protein